MGPIGNPQATNQIAHQGATRIEPDSPPCSVANTLATELLIRAFTEHYDHLPSTWITSSNCSPPTTENAITPGRAATADALGPGAMDAVESAWNRVQERATVAYTPEADWSHDIGLAQAVLRLLRYGIQALVRLFQTDLASAVSWYRETGSWVDTAVNDTFGG